MWRPFLTLAHAEYSFARQHGAFTSAAWTLLRFRPTRKLFLKEPDSLPSIAIKPLPRRETLLALRSLRADACASAATAVGLRQWCTTHNRARRWRGLAD